MAPKVTSSSTRSARKPAKPAVVTTSKGRDNRSKVSQAEVTRGSNGKPAPAGTRITNASQRATTGSATVTGGAKPSLPPARPKPNANPTRPSIGNVKGPASSPKPPGTNANLRPGNSRTAPSIPKPAKPSAPAPKPSSPNFSVAGARRLLGGALSAAGSTEMLLGGSRMLADQLERSGITRAPKGSRTLAEREKAAAEPVKPKPNMDRPGLRYEKMFDTQGGRGNYGLDRKPQPVAPLPTSVTRASSGGSGSSTPRSGGSSPRSSAPARSSAPPAPAKPGQKWEEFNPNRGTSKSNNPLLNSESGGIKLRDRMKNREDKDQASSASKLISKFDKDSGYQPKDKVDGSNVDTKKKLRSTTNEYDPKKRRYGG